MHCTKCGRETDEKSVFCKKCLAVMEQYPVKPGTAIQLPQRAVTPTRRAAPRKRHLPPEEVVIRQRKTIRWLVTAMVCVILIFGLSIAFLLQLQPKEEPKVVNGPRYNTTNNSSPGN